MGVNSDYSLLLFIASFRFRGKHPYSNYYATVPEDMTLQGLYEAVEGDLAFWCPLVDAGIF